MQSLDSVRYFTRGEPLNLRNVMQRVAPFVEQAAFSWEGEDGESCYAQIEKRQTRQYAQMCYLGCQEESDPVNICRLLEHLIKSAGAWKAWGVLADITEPSPLFEGFRKAGFTIWARQNIYHLSSQQKEYNEEEIRWRLWSSEDIGFMNALYKEIVPGAVQCIEPMTRKTALGLVAYQPKGHLVAYADLEYGPKGVWVQMVSSPEVRSAGLLQSLPRAIPELAGRQVYLCVRSYQPWLDAGMEETGYSGSEAQVLLVKHLVLRKSLERSAVKQIFESSTMEGSLPITQIK
ncbi:MAG TPA: hypothetical protein DD636_06975 [Anaerolineaceae bacterium]|nr:hypothetical protein [Anaerolineaceae bacterium]